MAASEQDIRNAERLSESITTKKGALSFLDLNGSKRLDAGAVGIGERGRLDPSFGDLSQSQRDSQNAYDFAGQTFRPQTWVAPGSQPQPTVNRGTSGPSIADILARDKFNFDKKQDSMDRSTALEALQFSRGKDNLIAQGYSDYYGDGKGSFNQGFENLLNMITAQGGVSEGNINKAYKRASTDINEGYTAAQGVGDSGFNALNAYLQANPNNPYAGMQAQVGSAPDAMSQYLGAYGVSDTPVQGQIQADQLQAQQGAGNFQNLIDVLSGVAQQGAGSRGAESQMAQLLFNTGLGQERAGYQSQASNAQAAALAQLQQQMYGDRFGVEGDRNNLANQLAQAVINAGGNVDEDEKEDEKQPPVIPPATVEQLLEQIAARQAAGTQSGGSRGNLMDMF